MGPRIIYDTIETIFRSIFHEDSEKIGPGDRIEVHHVRFERFLWDVNTYIHWNVGYIHGGFLNTWCTILIGTIFAFVHSSVQSIVVNFGDFLSFSWVFGYKFQNKAEIYICN